MSEHARLAPSSAHRWIYCPGSVKAEAAYPEPPSESAAEGTAAHWVAEQVLASYLPGSDETISASRLEGVTAPNGVIITEEIVEGVEMYVRDVLKITQRDGTLSAMEIEKRVKIDRVHADNWGTADCVIWTPGRLIVWDFKFGRKPVENIENWQLIEYAIGTLDEFTNHNGLADQETTVEMRIVQPRAYHVEGPVRDWKTTGSNLRGYANDLAVSAGQADLDDPPTKAGYHCEYCTARRGCITLQQAAAGVTDRVQDLQLHDLTPADTAVELAYLKKAQTLLNERLQALEAQALEQINNGVTVPGYGIGYGRGSFDWVCADSEVIAMGDLMGADLRKPEKPITPTQAKKKLDEAVINSYAVKNKGAKRLVETKDTIAGRVFSIIKPE